MFHLVCLESPFWCIFFLTLLTFYFSYQSKCSLCFFRVTGKPSILIFYKQDRPVGRTGSSGPLQQKYDGVFSQCRRWTRLSRISISTFTGPSMCSLFYLLLSLKKETTLLLMLSVINKLSTLTVPSMINFFFTNINLSNTTKLTLLDSFLQEVCIIC